MAAAEKAAGSTAFHYTEDPNLGHDVWDTYYPLPNGKTYFDWLFSQHTGSTTPAPTPTPAPKPSANDTVVKAGSSAALTDAQGNLWTLTGTGQVAVNGTADPTTANVTELAYVNGKVWQENTAQLWWSKSSPTDVWGPTNGTATSPLPASDPTPPAPPPSSTVTIAATDATPVVTQSNATVTASAGNHTITVNGTHDVITATGGDETILATKGLNTITTGAGHDVIRFAGTGNVVDGGTGWNQLYDTGSGNTIRIQAGAYDGIFGFTKAIDTLDLRPVLAGTTWNGSASTLGSYLHVASSNAGKDTMLSLSKTAGGAGSTIAVLHDTGSMTLATLLKSATI
jgi:hypothetical protein